MESIRVSVDVCALLLFWTLNPDVALEPAAGHRTRERERVVGVVLASAPRALLVKSGRREDGLREYGEWERRRPRKGIFKAGERGRTVDEEHAGSM